MVSRFNLDEGLNSISAIGLRVSPAGLCMQAGQGSYKNPQRS
jgi:hypothetical protein